MRTYILDLGKFRKKAGKTVLKVFTGRDYGADVRDRSKLDSEFVSNDCVVLKIPTDTFSITPSFLEELFYNIVKDHGKEALLERLKFDESNVYEIEEPLSEAIDRILQKINGLSR